MLIAVANLKFGCGQSTCAVNLACALAAEETVAGNRWEGARTVILLSVLMPENSHDHYCVGGKLPVSCEHLALLDANGDFWTKRVLEYAADVDYAIVDGPPHMHDAIWNMAGMSDLMLVPCSGADLEATASMIGLIRSTRATRDDGGPKCLLVPTRVGPGARAGEELVAALEALGEPVGPIIHEREAFADAFLANRWIGDTAPDGLAHADIEALAECVKGMSGWPRPSSGPAFQGLAHEAVPQILAATVPSDPAN